ncbi:hypothetical protein TWF788_003978 [Orbilia oligospora]|uniref:K Homology domain-containing protein n=1 Tax=Orbilia oligospora TaxID=2813651 RepID=A0A7C8JZ96_ORBOL|nr:hypothetical protein TWF788_003978 [Orbilia oligospora]
MADPNNVAALLAALTNQQQQRGAGAQTPQTLLANLQQQQQQPSAQQAPNTNALAALQSLLANVQQPGAPGGAAAPQGSFPLPQPTGSGALDLSNIRPTNSGSVSLQDAIAKARNFASERGIQPGSYQQPGGPRDFDRGSGGGNNRSYNQDARSRSRSPGRGSNYGGSVGGGGGGNGGPRDGNFNPNPYRDERRGRNQYNSPRPRDRSFSPPNRNRRNSPRGYRERSPQGEGNITDHMMIDASLVGLIIGRRGETLKRVEEMSGARVQFVADSRGEPERVCNITGPRAAVQSARQQIQTIISENSASSIRDDHRRNTYHGHGHGHGKHGGHGGGGGGGGGGSHGGGHSGGGGSGGGGGGGGGPGSSSGASARQDPAHHPVLKEGENSMQIMVPDKTVGLIIGRRGETIQDLQDRSGCHINIVGESKSVNGFRPVNLIGTTEAAMRAKALIMEIVESDVRPGPGGPGPQGGGSSGGSGGGGGGGGGGSRQQGGGYGNQGGDKNGETIRVPIDAVGMIIGKGGETIKEMQNTTGCRINVLSQQTSDGEREISLSGPPDAIARAKAAIDEKVDTARRQGQLKGSDMNSSGGQAAPAGIDPQAYQQALSAYAQAAAAAGGGGGGPPQSGSTDPANDPYQAYGGYQAYAQTYAQMYYAAIAAQQQQQNQQPGGPGAPGT